MAAHTGIDGDLRASGTCISQDWSDFVDVGWDMYTQRDEVDWFGGVPIGADIKVYTSPSYFLNAFDGDYIRGFAELIYWKYWLYPHTMDFGYSEVGAARTTILLQRFDLPKTITEVDIESPDFEVDISPPTEYLPLYERPTVVTITNPAEIVVENSPIEFIFGLASTTLYVSATLVILIFHRLAGEVIGKQELTYSFQTLKSRMSDGKLFREAQLLQPVRSTKLKVGEGDPLWKNEFYANMIESGKIGLVIPMWCFWEKLTAQGDIDDASIYVSDSSEFEVLGKVMLFDGEKYELKVVTSISSNELVLSSVLINEFKTYNTWVVPCFVGLGTLSNMRLIGRSAIMEGELTITELVERLATPPVSGTGTLELRPEEAVMEGRIIPDRKVIGEKSGLVETVNFNTTQRTPTLHSLAYFLHGDTTYKTLREMFFKARGMAGNFRLVSWRGELTVFAEAAGGASELKVTPANYVSLSTVYDYICLDWGHAYQIVEVTSAQNFTTYAQLTLADPLDRLVKGGSKLHLVPLVYFAADKLNMRFQLKQVCEVDVGFVEEVR